MATHSHLLAWEISWTEEPGGLVDTKSHIGQSDFFFFPIELSLIKLLITHTRESPDLFLFSS